MGPGQTLYASYWGGPGWFLRHVYLLWLRHQHALCGGKGKPEYLLLWGEGQQTPPELPDQILLLSPNKGGQCHPRKFSMCPPVRSSTSTRWLQPKTSSSPYPWLYPGSWHSSKRTSTYLWQGPSPLWPPGSGSVRWIKGQSWYPYVQLQASELPASNSQTDSSPSSWSLLHPSSSIRQKSWVQEDDQRCYLCWKKRCQGRGGTQAGGEENLAHKWLWHLRMSLTKDREWATTDVLLATAIDPKTGSW